MYFANHNMKGEWPWRDHKVGCYNWVVDITTWREWDHDVTGSPWRRNKEWENETMTWWEAYYDAMLIGKRVRVHIDINWVALRE